jgi:hypothetical protein
MTPWRGLSSLLSRQSCRLFFRGKVEVTLDSGKVEMTLDPAGRTARATRT